MRAPRCNRNGIARFMLFNIGLRMRVPGVKYRKAKEITYFSKVTNTYRKALVLLPREYEKGEKYPVLYLLHGFGGSENSWIWKRADIIIQNMVMFFSLRPGIVVMPNCAVTNVENYRSLSKMEKCQCYDLTEKELVESLMPYIEKHFPVRKGKENTGIAGNSMGGRNAVYTALKHSDLFDYVGAFSMENVVKTKQINFPPLFTVSEFMKLVKKSDFKVFMIMVGKQDYDCGNISYDLHRKLKKLKKPHVFYDTWGFHQNLVWQNGLYNFLTYSDKG